MVQHGSRKSRTLEVGTQVQTLSLQTVRGGEIQIPDGTRIVHLQLRRFAGCPICNLHVRSIARRHDELVAAGILEVAVFHSTVEEMRAHADLPFDVVADPKRDLYRVFGVEPSIRSLLDPRSWPAAAEGALAIVRRAAGRQPSLGTLVHGGPFGLPGDFLVAPDGYLLALKYGVHADDQWSVDEVLSLTKAVGHRSFA